MNEGREFWGRVVALLPAGSEFSLEADSGYLFFGSAGDPKSLHVLSRSHIQTRPVAVSMTNTLPEVSAI
jgi:hypothetical protein